MNRSLLRGSSDPIDAARPGIAADVATTISTLIATYQVYPSGFAAWQVTSLDEPYLEELGVFATAINEALVQRHLVDQRAGRSLLLDQEDRRRDAGHREGDRYRGERRQEAGDADDRALGSSLTFAAREKFEPSAMAGRRELFCPYIRKGGTTGMTASGFPTRGRAHPSVRGGSLLRSCREKNCSSYRTSQKARSPAWQRALDGQERFDHVDARSNVEREIKSLMRAESDLWANQRAKLLRRPASALRP